MKDPLLLALRQIQAERRQRAKPARVRLTDDQIHELTEHGELTIELSRSPG